jgi:hypothetical protein
MIVFKQEIFYEVNFPSRASNFVFSLVAELAVLAKFKFCTSMSVEMEIPFHDFTYFAQISIGKMKIKWNTLNSKRKWKIGGSNQVMDIRLNFIKKKVLNDK